MPLEVVEVYRVGDARELVDVAHVAGQVGEVFQALAVALEVPVVYRVEAYQRGEQADIGLGQTLPQQELVFRQVDVQVSEAAARQQLAENFEACFGVAP